MRFRLRLTHLLKEHNILNAGLEIGPLLYAFWKIQPGVESLILEETVHAFIDYYVSCYEQLLNKYNNRRELFIEVVSEEDPRAGFVDKVRGLVGKKAHAACARLNQNLLRGRISKYSTRYVGRNLTPTITAIISYRIVRNYAAVNFSRSKVSIYSESRLAFVSGQVELCAALLYLYFRDLKAREWFYYGRLSWRGVLYLNLHDSIGLEFSESSPCFPGRTRTVLREPWGCHVCYST